MLVLVARLLREGVLATAPRSWIPAAGEKDPKLVNARSARCRMQAARSK